VREVVPLLERSADVLLALPLLVYGLATADVSPSIGGDARTAAMVEPQADQRSNADQQDDADRQPPPQDKKPDSSDEKKPPTPPHTGIRALVDSLVVDIVRLPSKPNLYITLIGGAAALAVHPADQDFNIQTQSHYTLVNDIFLPAKYLGDTPEQVGLALATYAYGRIAQAPKVSHFGMDLVRAQILCELMVQPVKYATQRERPDASNSLSFPSGHSCATFASATVIERHLGWKGTAIGYLLATYVATSRLHDNRHYLSDVTFGAALGLVAGRTVTQHGRDVWQLSAAPLPGGTAVVVARTW
jgi:hypothetical protein